MPELYVGLMSGTSLDGVDAVLADCSGSPRLLASRHRAFPTALREELFALQSSLPDELHRAALAANALAHAYAETVTDLLSGAGCPAAEVRAIGCHGQTLRHRPEAGYSLQIGNAALLAELTQMTVVADFRSRDIAAGGQGAPLVPAFHQAVFGRSVHRAIVNVGGIANVTDLPPAGPVRGFDCGPGNVLMDAWIARHRGEHFDRDGAWAASGRVLPALLNRMLDEPFFDRAPPKSTGRDLFNLAWLEARLEGSENPADVQATLLELTAHSVGEAVARGCAGVTEAFFCGGGARNRQLMTRLQALLPGIALETTDALGIAAEWVEALAFAWLAQRALKGESGNLPAVTGASGPRCLGAIHRA